MSIAIVAKVFHDMNPIGIPDLPDDEYKMEAEMLLCRPGPYTGDEIYFVFDTMFNTIIDSETGDEYHLNDPIVPRGEWCDRAAELINNSLGA